MFCKYDHFAFVKMADSCTYKAYILGGQIGEVCCILFICSISCRMHSEHISWLDVWYICRFSWEASVRLWINFRLLLVISLCLRLVILPMMRCGALAWLGCCWNLSYLWTSDGLTVLGNAVHMCLQKSDHSRLKYTESIDHLSCNCQQPESRNNCRSHECIWARDYITLVLQK